MYYCEVSMDHLIPHFRHLTPGKLFIGIFYLVFYLFARLAYYFDISNHRIYSFLIFYKTFKVFSLNIFFYQFHGFQDVFQKYFTGSCHTFTASLSMESFKSIFIPFFGTRSTFRQSMSSRYSSSLMNFIRPMGSEKSTSISISLSLSYSPRT